MPFNVHGLKIKGKGPTSRGVRVETESGKEIEGITSLQITVLPDSLIEAVLGFASIEEINLEDLEGQLDLSDVQLIKELRRRGYRVVPDDSDLAQELHP